MAVAAILAASGCAVGGDEEPQGATGAPAQIGELVARLERAVAAGDFRLICDDILSSGARRRAGGPDCADRSRAATGGLERPSLSVRSIEVRGGRATVSVRSSAPGTRERGERLGLVSENGDWRLDSVQAAGE